VSVTPTERRTFLAATLGTVLCDRLAAAQEAVTYPAVSEAASPIEVITPVASDGHMGLGVLRRPPGRGPFPAVIWLHGGITTVSSERLHGFVRAGATATRLLAAGYLVVAPTYRSRDHDLQSPVSLTDALAVVDYVRRLAEVDRESVVVAGCSGGGDLALQVASQTAIGAVVLEEPVTAVTAGMFNNSVPKQGERYTPADGMFLLADPKRYYTAQFQRILRDTIARIECPIFIVQGGRNQNNVNRFNEQILVPEMRAAKKIVEVRTYPDQGHCFCAQSGRPQQNVPPSGPSAARAAFKDIDQFCRRHLRTTPKAIDARLITWTPVQVDFRG
jgi:acetyl esterase/lipase